MWVGRKERNRDPWNLVCATAQGLRTFWAPGLVAKALGPMSSLRQLQYRANFFTKHSRRVPGTQDNFRGPRNVLIFLLKLEKNEYSNNNEPSPDYTCFMPTLSLKMHTFTNDLFLRR